MSITDDMFDKAISETSFALPSEGRSKSGKGNKHPLVAGEYLGHITQVNSKVVDVKGGEYKARVYDYLNIIFGFVKPATLNARQ